MRHLNEKKALVLFSGGQDSSIALFWALTKFEAVATIGFDYGQRHCVELETRLEFFAALQKKFPKQAARLGNDAVLDLSALGEISDTALTRDVEIAFDEEGLPSTFVPGRNLLFLTFAGALAYRQDAGVLIGGMCDADFSGYPDCRRPAIDAQEQALQTGMDCDIRIETPLMSLTKAESWRMAENLGGATLVETVIEHSHSCYIGSRDQRSDWGYGCGTCPACELRAKGYLEYIASK